MIHSNNLTLPLVQSYIKGRGERNSARSVTVEKIVNEVSRTYDVSPEDIFSKEKSADIALARQISIYIVSQVMDMSSIEIGRKFGKDHSTVLYTLDKIKRDFAQTNPKKSLLTI